GNRLKYGMKDISNVKARLITIPRPTPVRYLILLKFPASPNLYPSVSDNFQRKIIVAKKKPPNVIRNKIILLKKPRAVDIINAKDEIANVIAPISQI
ncbi:MAG: hypothetical protein J6D42_07940, partial [Clostridia bacterium]|nr:hypothetical protein [Clostridia bacterium]